MTATQTRVAEIALETKKSWNADAPEAGRTLTSESAPLVGQPAGVRLDNDGCYYDWLEMGATWVLTSDGMGWRATTDAPGWEYSREHVLRLADATGPHGSFIDYLPLADGGTFTLEQGVTYCLRLGADKGMTRTIIVLSV